MTSPDAEVNDTDLAGQAVPVIEPDVETPGPEITLDDHGHRANLADVADQRRGVPADEDDYDR